MKLFRFNKSSKSNKSAKEHGIDPGSAAGLKNPRGYIYKRFFPYTAAVVFVGFVITLFFLFHPSNEAYKRFQQKNVEADHIAAMYLSELIELYPEDKGLKVLLAKQKYSLGELEQAYKLIEPYINKRPDSPEAWQARWLYYEIIRVKTYAQQKSTKAYADGMMELRKLVKQLAKAPLLPLQLATLAQQAEGMDMSKQALEIYTRLIAEGSLDEAQHYASAARLALSEGYYLKSAEWYFKAEHKAEKLVDQRAFYLAGLNSLQAGNLMVKHFNLAIKNLGALKDDYESVIALSRFSLAAGKLDVAAKIVAQALQLQYKDVTDSLSGAGSIGQLASGLTASYPLVGTANQYFSYEQEKMLHGYPLAVKIGLFPEVYKKEINTLAAVDLPGYQYKPVYQPYNYQIITRKNKVLLAKLRSYNPDLYATAYAIFLAANDVNNAYTVALAAVAQMPDSIAWRERLAQVAVWTSHPREALLQWRYLVVKHKMPDVMEKALTIAEQFNDTEAMLELLNLQIKSELVDSKTWTRLAKTYENLGYPEKVILILHKEFIARNDKNILAEIVRVCTSHCTYKEELKFLNLYDKLYIATLPMVMRKAELYFNHYQLEKAFVTLEAVAPRIDLKEVKYWRQYAALAQDLQRYPLAESIYKKLFDSGVGNVNDLNSLLQLYLAEEQFKQAFKYASLGWNKYKHVSYLNIMLSSGVESKNWTGLKKVLAAITPAQAKVYQNNPQYWYAKAGVADYEHKYDEVNKIYVAGIKYLPQATSLKVAYLWFLISRRDKMKLALMLEKLRPMLVDNATLREPAAAGYRMLGNVRLAIGLYQMNAEQHMGDYDWLNNYAATLLEGGYYQAGNYIKAYAWNQLKFQMGKAGHESSPQELVTYARLSMEMDPSDASNALMTKLIELSDDPEANETVLAWALRHNNYALANTMVNRNKILHNPTPAWILQTLALANDDRYELHDLLKKEMSNLPYRDRVAAAERTGDVRLAKNLAFNSMRDHPNDNLMYDIFRSVLIPNSNDVEFESEYKQVGKVSGFHQSAQGTYFIRTGKSITPSLSLWFPSTKDEAVIIGVPDIVEDFNVAYKSKTQHGYWMINAGQRLSMKNYFSLALEYQYLINQKLTATLNIGYNQLAEDNTILLLGAAQHDIGLTLQYLITQRDILTALVNQKFYYTQDGFYLGRGAQEAALYRHRFWVTPPTLFVGAGASFQQYSPASGPIQGEISRFIPANLPQTIEGTIIPVNFSQIGVDAGFNPEVEEEMGEVWRPFFVASVFKNSSSESLGMLFDGGVAGGVFGADHMALYADYSKGAQNANETNITIGIRYKNKL